MVSLLSLHAPDLVGRLTCNNFFDSSSAARQRVQLPRDRSRNPGPFVSSPLLPLSFTCSDVTLVSSFFVPQCTEIQIQLRAVRHPNTPSTKGGKGEQPFRVNPIYLVPAGILHPEYSSSEPEPYSIAEPLRKTLSVLCNREAVEKLEGELFPYPCCFCPSTGSRTQRWLYSEHTRWSAVMWSRSTRLWDYDVPQIDFLPSYLPTVPTTVTASRCSPAALSSTTAEASPVTIPQPLTHQTVATSGNPGGVVRLPPSNPSTSQSSFPLVDHIESQLVLRIQQELELLAEASLSARAEGDSAAATLVEVDQGTREAMRDGDWTWNRPIDGLEGRRPIAVLEVGTDLDEGEFLWEDRLKTLESRRSSKVSLTNTFALAAGGQFKKGGKGGQEREGNGNGGGAQSTPNLMPFLQPARSPSSESSPPRDVPFFPLTRILPSSAHPHILARLSLLQHLSSSSSPSVPSRSPPPISSSKRRTFFLLSPHHPSNSSICTLSLFTALLRLKLFLPSGHAWPSLNSLMSSSRHKLTTSTLTFNPTPFPNSLPSTSAADEKLQSYLEEIGVVTPSEKRKKNKKKRLVGVSDLEKRERAEKAEMVMRGEDPEKWVLGEEKSWTGRSASENEEGKGGRGGKLLGWKPRMKEVRQYRMSRVEEGLKLPKGLEGWTGRLEDEGKEKVVVQQGGAGEEKAPEDGGGGRAGEIVEEARAGGDGKTKGEGFVWPQKKQPKPTEVNPQISSSSTRADDDNRLPRSSFNNYSRSRPSNPQPQPNLKPEPKPFRADRRPPSPAQTNDTKKPRPRNNERSWPRSPQAQYGLDQPPSPPTEGGQGGGKQG
jgi:hypothetical protein